MYCSVRFQISKTAVVLPAIVIWKVSSIVAEVSTVTDVLKVWLSVQRPLDPYVLAHRQRVC